MTEDAFEHQMANLTEGFRLRAPDALSRAKHIRDLYYANASSVAQVVGGAPAHDATAEYYFARGERVNTLIEENAKRGPNPNDTGPTPETSRMPNRKTPVMRLVETGSLTHDHLRDAIEICEIFEAITAPVMSKRAGIVSSGRPPKRSFRTNDYSLTDKIVDLRTHVYLPWTKEMHRRDNMNLPLVMDVVIHCHSIRGVVGDYHRGHDRVVSFLRDGLDLYANFRKTHREAGG